MAQRFPVGARVQVNMGVDRGKTATVISKWKIPTDPRGIPKVGGGHYHPMQKRDVAIEYDRGGLDVHDPVHLTRINPQGRYVMTRLNPARWAGGYLDYQQRMRNNPRRRRRRNPYRRNPSKAGLGIGIGTVALLGVGGYLAYQYFSGGGSLFGPTAPATVPQGFVPVGSGVYRGPDGALYARNPTTGAMVRAPVGSTPPDAETLLTQAGISLIPQAANTLANWVGGLFGSQRSATTPAPGTTYATRPPTPNASTMPSSGLPTGIAPLIPALPAAGQALSSIWPLTSGTDYPAISPDVLTSSGEDIEALAFVPGVPTVPDPYIMPTDSAWWDTVEPDGMLVDSMPDADTGWMDWAQYDYGYDAPMFDMPAYDYGFDVPSFDYSFYDVPDVSFDIPEFDYGAADVDFGFMGFGRLRRPPTTAVRGYGRRPASIG